MTSLLPIYSSIAQQKMLIFFIFFLSLLSSFATKSFNSEVQSLLSFTKPLILPSAFTSTWNSSASTPCQWVGIECNKKFKVVALNLSSQGISGRFGPGIGQLKFIKTIDFHNNNIFGLLPIEVVNCTLLEYLDLSQNLLTGSLPNLENLQKLKLFSVFQNLLSGKIPSSLFMLPELVDVYLDTNNLSGSIPPNIGNASRLQLLYLSYNQLSGKIPISIGNCSSLLGLYLDNNMFSGVLPNGLDDLQNLEELMVNWNYFEGQIPFGSGNCRNLKLLILSSNLFSGEIPQGLGNCSGLTFFAALNNCLTGHIPSSFGSLGMLSDLHLSWNRLSSRIPLELGKCRSLTSLSLQSNLLEGEIPSELGMLIELNTLKLFQNHLSGEIPLGIWKIQTLEVVFIYDNNFSGNLPVEMTQLRRLTNVSLYGNLFSGEIPQTLGINSSLMALDFTGNKFSGKIPPHLCFGKRLSVLDLGLNQLEGSIPLDVGSCFSLTRLILSQNNLVGFLPKFAVNSSMSFMDVSSNNISGSISSSLGNCRNLNSVNLSMNNLSGPIPPELGNLAKLQQLDISSNHLQGSLPPQISKLLQLYYLNLGSNSLNGTIPSSLRGLTQLSTLILSENRFTGGIPDFFAKFDKLLELYLGNNLLSGNIPSSLGELKSLTYVLNLSGNRFTGHLPPELEKLNQLQRLDLSCNNLTGSLVIVGKLYSLIEVNVSYNLFNGPIPESLLKLPGSSPTLFTGNPRLCIPCELYDKVNGSLNRRISQCDHPSSNRKSFSGVGISMLVLGGLLFCVLCIILLGCVFMLYKKRFVDECPSLLNKVMEATKNLDEEFVIGRGAHGTVYKAVLRQDLAYAVKRLIFTTQSRANASMKREIEIAGQVRHRNLLQIEEFWFRQDDGLILYAYMQNGSLHGILHEVNPAPRLTWDVRYRIAMGTAHGLVYLHYDCDPHIVHRDIKPANILLDSELEPHISDFGIAKLLEHSTASVHSSSAMGTIGYMAPEIGFTSMGTRESDVYSYGVVLLELITRKKALNSSFPEHMNIVTWAHSTWSRIEDIHFIADPSLIEEFVELVITEEVREVLMVALLCTVKNPRNRPTMRDVVRLLEDVRKKRRTHVIDQE